MNSKGREALLGPAWAIGLLLSTSALGASYTECVGAMDRVSNLGSRGDALCGMQQEVLDAIEFARQSCVGVPEAAGSDWDSARNQFLRDAARCPGGTGSLSSQPSSASGPPPVSSQIRRDAESAQDFLHELEKCDSVYASERAQCRKLLAQLYRANGGSGGTRHSPTPLSSPSDDPSTGGTQSGGSRPTAGGSPQSAGSPPSTPSSSTRKDPSANYGGKSCSYFTRPAVEDGRMNFYANGSCVSYGPFSYDCDDGHWTTKGPADVFKCRQAEDIEGTTGT